MLLLAEHYKQADEDHRDTQDQQDQAQRTPLTGNVQIILILIFIIHVVWLVTVKRQQSIFVLWAAVSFRSLWIIWAPW